MSMLLHRSTLGARCQASRPTQRRRIDCAAVNSNTPYSNGTSPPSSAPGPPAKPLVVTIKSVSLFDAMKFNGPAPELVNGRLAMLGFLIATSHESQTGETFLYQLQHGDPATYLWFALAVYGSMVPILKAAKMEPFGMFTPKAEITNGRAAMLGFAVIMALEWKTGVPFF